MSVRDMEERIEMLEQSQRDAASQFDAQQKVLTDVSLKLDRYIAKMEGYTGGVNCPGCGTKYRGTQPEGMRVCPKGCGARGF